MWIGTPKLQRWFSKVNLVSFFKNFLNEQPSNLLRYSKLPSRVVEKGSFEKIFKKGTGFSRIMSKIYQNEHHSTSLRELNKPSRELELLLKEVSHY